MNKFEQIVSRSWETLIRGQSLIKNASKAKKRQIEATSVEKYSFFHELFYLINILSFRDQKEELIIDP